MVTIREARIEDAPGIAKVHVDSWRTTYAGIVSAANPARRFYEAIGGQPVKTERIDMGGAMLDEVAYGWQDISMIVQEKQL